MVVDFRNRVALAVFVSAVNCLVGEVVAVDAAGIEAFEVCHDGVEVGSAFGRDGQGAGD